jgi:hypothetical protein
MKMAGIFYEKSKTEVESKSNKIIAPANKI